MTQDSKNLLRRWTSFTAAALLLAISGLHVIWSQSTWPFESNAEFMQSLIGTSDVSRMPSAAEALVVAVGLMAAAWIVLASVDVVGWPFSRRLLYWCGYAVTAIFLVRGIAGLLLPLTNLTVSEPFARLNLAVYSPVTILLGASIFVSLSLRSKRT